MRWIFEPQNQMGRIESATLKSDDETRINRLNQQRRSLDYRTYLHQFVAPDHLSAHADEACRWGEGKHAARASREEGCLPPRSRRSHASTTACCRRRLSSSSTTINTRNVCRVFDECCNRDCEERGKAFVVVTVTIRSHRLVVRPEVCASG